MLYISLPLQGLLLLLSLFYEMCEKKITFSCTRSFRGSNGTLYTVLSISLSFSWTFPREKRARGSVCPATGVNVDWISHTAQEREAAKGQEKNPLLLMLRGPKEFSILFFLLVHFSFSIFAVDYSAHRPPNGIHTHTDELYSERPATEMQPSALYIICLSALKNIFIDYFTLWRSDWAPAAMGHSFPPCKNKDVWLLQRPKSSYSFTRHEMI